MLETVPMQRAERDCTECGKPHRGVRLKCGACRSAACVKERTCPCGKVHRSAHTRCDACRQTERVCTGCGKGFRGNRQKCLTCRSQERACTECGVTYRGVSLICRRCERTERACTECGRTYRGTNLQCPKCYATERTCACGNTFRGVRHECTVCRYVERSCGQCGGTFRGSTRSCRSCRWKAMDPAVRRAQGRKDENARRARKRAAQVAGPVPRDVYMAIRDEGPCVYCGGAADTVEHITPLSRGGWEHPDNLVPCCGSCNYSKNNRLLTEWSPERVARAVATSLKVAAAWVALTAAS